MLLINLFNIQNNFLQTIKYDGLLGIEEDCVKINVKAVKRAVLLSDFSLNICTKENLKDIFVKTGIGARICFLSATILSEVIFWKNKFRSLSLLISYKQDAMPKINESYAVKVGWDNTMSQYFVYLSEDEWDEIFQAVFKCRKDEIIEIILKIDDNEQIPVLSIKYKDESNIKIYKPFIQEQNPNYLKSLIEEDFNFYYSCYTDILYIIFPLIAMQDSKLKLISKEKNRFTLELINSCGSVFLYDSNYVPYFCFFNEFNIKLFIKQDKSANINMLETTSQRTGSSVALECIRFKDARQEKLSVQMNFYKQDMKNPKIIFPVMTRDTSYVNFNFPSEIMTFNKESVDIFMKIKKLQNNEYNFVLYFPKDEDKLSLSLENEFKKSIKKIKLITYGKTKDQYEELIITRFLKYDTHGMFILHFYIFPSDKLDNKANKTIYDILENKKGFFIIQVCNSKDIIMECKLNLRETIMFVFSSNRLEEHIENIAKKINGAENDTQPLFMLDDQGKKNVSDLSDAKTGDYNPSLGHVVHKSYNSNCNNKNDTEFKSVDSPLKKLNPPGIKRNITIKNVPRNYLLF